MVTYVNISEVRSLEDFTRLHPQATHRELIWFDFGKSNFSWMYNSFACQQWLKRIGREDLVRPLDDPPQ